MKSYLLPFFILLGAILSALSIPFLSTLDASNNKSPVIAVQNDSPWRIKLRAVGVLEGVTTTDIQLQNDINLAKDAIAASLSENGQSLFLDHQRILPPPNGNKVFRNEKQAADIITNILKGGGLSADIETTLRRVLVSLVAADRAIAEFSIASAQRLVDVGRGDGSTLAQAQLEFDQAASESNEAKAIEGYERAWELSQQVVQDNGLAIGVFRASNEPFSSNIASTTVAAILKIPGNLLPKPSGRVPQVFLDFNIVIQNPSDGSVIRTIVKRERIKLLNSTSTPIILDQKMTAKWNGRTDQGHTAPDGTYEYVAFGELFKIVRTGSNTSVEQLEAKAFPVLGTFVLDNTPPTIQIVFPDAVSTTTDASINIEGIVNDALSGVGVVLCNGLLASLSNSNFSCDVPLNPGANLIDIDASDIAGNASSTSILVNRVVNTPPVANDDGGPGFETDEETSFTTASVLANDSDIDIGDVLSVSNVVSTSTIGQLVDNGDGTFAYDPDGNFEQLADGDTAQDMFSYTVTDGIASSSPATVTITVMGVNDAPVANGDSGVGFQTNEDTIFTTANVLANDVDVDMGDLLSVIDVVATTTAGQVVNNGDGTFNYNPQGQFELLNTGQQVTESFRYVVSDLQGATSTATVLITVNGVTDVTNTPSGGGGGGGGRPSQESTLILGVGGVDSGAFRLFATLGGPNPPNQTFNVINEGTLPLDWEVLSDTDWIGVSPTSGRSVSLPDQITVSFDISNLALGTHTGTITINVEDAENSPQTIQVTITILPPPGTVLTEILTDLEPGEDIEIETPDGRLRLLIPASALPLDDDDDIEIEVKNLDKDTVPPSENINLEIIGAFEVNVLVNGVVTDFSFIVPVQVTFVLTEQELALVNSNPLGFGLLRFNEDLGMWQVETARYNTDPPPAGSLIASLTEFSLFSITATEVRVAPPSTEDSDTEPEPTPIPFERNVPTPTPVAVSTSVPVATSVSQTTGRPTATVTSISSGTQVTSTPTVAAASQSLGTPAPTITPLPTATAPQAALPIAPAPVATVTPSGEAQTLGELTESEDDGGMIGTTGLIILIVVGLGIIAGGFIVFQALVAARRRREQA